MYKCNDLFIFIRLYLYTSIMRTKWEMAISKGNFFEEVKNHAFTVTGFVFRKERKRKILVPRSLNIYVFII